MGHLIGDKKAIDITFPAATVGDHGDLFRVNGFTGFLINDITAAATNRGRALEIALNRAWKIKLPAALNPAVGTNLKWSAGAGFKRGDTDLIAGGALEAGVCKVVTAKNADGYAEVVLTQQIPEV